MGDVERDLPLADMGVAVSTDGRSAALRAEPQASQAEPAATNAVTPEALLSILSDITQALYSMAACERCRGLGSVTRTLGLDECPVCLGAGSTRPHAFRYVEKAARQCENLTLEMRA